MEHRCVFFFHAQETYCDVLVRYKQELRRPIQEADQFFRAMEVQMGSFTLLGINTRIFHS
jgi:hypothetical protein